MFESSTLTAFIFWLHTKLDLLEKLLVILSKFENYLCTIPNSLPYVVVYVTIFGVSFKCIYLPQETIREWDNSDAPCNNLYENLYEFLPYGIWVPLYGHCPTKLSKHLNRAKSHLIYKNQYMPVKPRPQTRFGNFMRSDDTDNILNNTFIR